MKNRETKWSGRTLRLTWKVQIEMQLQDRIGWRWRSTITPSECCKWTTHLHMNSKEHLTFGISSICEQQFGKKSLFRLILKEKCAVCGWMEHSVSWLTGILEAPLLSECLLWALILTLMLNNCVDTRHKQSVPALDALIQKCVCKII